MTGVPIYKITALISDNIKLEGYFRNNFQEYWMSGKNTYMTPHTIWRAKITINGKTTEYPKESAVFYQPKIGTLIVVEPVKNQNILD